MDELKTAALDTPTDTENEVSTLVDRIQHDLDVPSLVTEVASLRVKADALEADNARLNQRIHELQDHLALTTPTPIDHSYSFEQFMQKLSARLGRTWGSRTDYAQATLNTPGSRVVTTDEIQHWKKEGRVPEDVYVQISWLHYLTRSGRNAPDWSDENMNHLVVLYQSDPHQSNSVLAQKCSDDFGRDITESSIRGQLYRLGRAGRVPLHRPK